MGRYSDLLYARPSFVEGMARVTDLGATLEEYNTAPTGEQADLYAMRADWRQVGDDLSSALAACAQQMDRQPGAAPARRRARRR